MILKKKLIHSTYLSPGKISITSPEKLGKAHNFLGSAEYTKYSEFAPKKKLYLLFTDIPTEPKRIGRGGGERGAGGEGERWGGEMGRGDGEGGGMVGLNPPPPSPIPLLDTPLSVK